MSALRSVLLLCWRDIGHPQGGGSEAYLQRIGAQLAASGIAVTLRTARYPGAPRHELVDGVRISRAGGRYSVYLWALLAMAAARCGLGPLRRVRPDVVVDTQNGWPFVARLLYGRRSLVLVHHCHREQWPVAGRMMGRLGWYVESMLSPRLHRRNQYVTVSLPSARDLIALGVDSERIAVVRNGLDEAPSPTLSGPRAPTPRVVVLSRLVPHKQIEDALAAVAELQPRIPGLHLDIVGGGWWRQRLVDHVHRLDIADAVTFHGHVDDVTKHHVLQSSWVHLLPSRKEGWGLAVIEAAQHGVPTIGYRSSGGLADSIVDGVTGILVTTGPNWWLGSNNCCPIRCCVTNSAPRHRRVAVSSPGGKAPKRCAACWRQCRPAVLSAAWFEPASTDLILGAARRRVFAVV
ncbi:glycosyltransferase [Mycobacterium tuberculosis]|nr:glycosyltransferase [Mycobacterium tuberculosis]